MNEVDDEVGALFMTDDAFYNKKCIDLADMMCSFLQIQLPFATFSTNL